MRTLAAKSAPPLRFGIFAPSADWRPTNYPANRPHNIMLNDGERKRASPNGCRQDAATDWRPLESVGDR